MNFKQSDHITIDELRQCPEFAHLDDCLAQNMVNTIQEFCLIIASQYNTLSGDEETVLDNSHLINKS